MTTAKITLGGREYILQEACTTVGRADDNTIVLDDESVSGHHAQIESVQDGYVLRDVGSSNGTLVNDTAIQDVALNNGDLIQFGGITASFEVFQNAKAATPTFSQESFGQKALRVGRAAARNTKKLALIAVKQAQRKKLEMVDLPAAERTIGIKALECGLFKEELPAFYVELAALDDRIASLKHMRHLAEGARFRHKVKHAALVAKDQACLQAASFKRNRTIIKLGRTIRGSPLLSPLIESQLKKSRTIIKHLESLDAQISIIRSDFQLAKPVASSGQTIRKVCVRRNLAFAALGACCLGLIGGAVVFNRYRQAFSRAANKGEPPPIHAEPDLPASLAIDPLSLQRIVEMTGWLRSNGFSIPAPDIPIKEKILFSAAAYYPFCKLYLVVRRVDESQLISVGVIIAASYEDTQAASFGEGFEESNRMLGNIMERVTGSEKISFWLVRETLRLMDNRKESTSGLLPGIKCSLSIGGTREGVINRRLVSAILTHQN